MSDALDKFMGKPKKVVVMGEEFVLEPLVGEDIGVLTQNGRGEKAAMNGLLKHYLEKHYGETYTDKRINEIPLGVKMKFLQPILEVNGFDEEDIAKHVSKFDKG